jgi:hypothetical protein
VSYCFRIRCNLGATSGLTPDETEWILATKDGHGEDVVLRPVGAQTFGEARQLSVRGAGFASEETAWASGRRWQQRIQVAFARMNIGAGFGDRAAVGRWTEPGLRGLEATHGIQRLLNPDAPLKWADDRWGPGLDLVGFQNRDWP